MIAPGASTNSAAEGKNIELRDDGRRATIHSALRTNSTVLVELDRRTGHLKIRLNGEREWRFWCQGSPQRSRNQVKWPDETQLEVKRGRIDQWLAEGFSTTLSVGNGLLPLNDPVTKSYPLLVIAPTSGTEVELEVRRGRFP